MSSEAESNPAINEEYDEEGRRINNNGSLFVIRVDNNGGGFI